MFLLNMFGYNKSFSSTTDVSHTWRKIIALNGNRSVYVVEEGALLLTLCIHHRPTPACERSLTMATGQLAPSSLSTAQMLEVPNGFCPGSYILKHLLIKFLSPSKLILSFFSEQIPRRVLYPVVLFFLPKESHLSIKVTSIVTLTARLPLCHWCERLCLLVGCKKGPYLQLSFARKF